MKSTPIRIRATPNLDFGISFSFRDLYQNNDFFIIYLFILAINIFKIIKTSRSY